MSSPSLLFSPQLLIQSHSDGDDKKWCCEIGGDNEDDNNNDEMVICNCNNDSERLKTILNIS